ncbi:MAG: ATP-dependent DNA helicase [Ferruginibacter sp.]
MQLYRDKLLKKFNEEYAKLNANQRKAVDAIEGPVMVIAGPGTGKTQILAARIGKILLETDAMPQNILCLTYTDAGTIAMRKRLQQFIGADAYKVTISTFHGFCNDIIQENLYLFEKTSMDPISDLEKIELFKSLIDAFPKNHPLKRYRGDVYFEVNNLRQLFADMKKEGWQPETLLQGIDQYVNELATSDEFVYKTSRAGKWKAGDLKPAYYDELQRMEKLKAAIHEFPHYQNSMRQRSRYDFDDMINWIIKAFEENKNLLANYQERYQYILVDEYQDTSGTQNKLVQLLIEFWERPNIFVVGDDDQSIYRFQGASVENMLVFADAYKDDLEKVVLTHNYRSVQPILDIAKTIIDKNEERLVKQVPGLSKELQSSNDKLKTLQLQPVIREYNAPREEMADTSFRIKALLQQGVAPGRIAVIYKENKYGEELAAYFKLQDIPFYSKRSINILVQPFIHKIIQVLRYLNAELDIPYGGDEMLFEILHYDFYKIPAIEIAKITVEVNSKNYGGGGTSIRRMICEKAAQPPANLFDTGLHEGLKKVSAFIEELITEVPNVTLQQLFEDVIQKAGIVTWVLQQPNKIELLQQLTAFFDFIKEETSRNTMLQLPGLISTIDLMEKEGLAISMNSITGTDAGVNLLTAHGSKGLEFEYVFIAGTNSGNWEKKRKPGGGYKFPPSLFTSKAKGSDAEELRRLFYVAITRAEKHLVISYSKYKADGKETEPSMFIAEIQEAHQLQTEPVSVGTEELLLFQSLQFNEKAPEIAAAEEDFVNGLLEKFVMNVTALNNYLKCPLEFYYKNLVRIPSGKSEATEFGSAIHYALERMFKKMQDHPKNEFAPVEDVMQDFEWYLKKHRQFFTKEAYARRFEYGHEVLKNYYEKYKGTWNKIVTVERNIRGVVVNGVPLKGKLDKLEFDGSRVNVVDYKTGDIDKAKDKLQGPGEKNPAGGDYWRQAVFYKLLVDHYQQKEWTVVSTEFDFIEPDNKKQFRKEKIVISPADITTVTQQLSDVWEKIQRRDFYTGCGKADCHWCNFVKDNHMAIAMHDLKTEETEEI